MLPSTSGELDAEQQFLRAVGDAVAGFLKESGFKQTELAEKLGLNSRQALNAYFNDKADGTRTRLPLWVFYLILRNFRRFHFDYNGYRISAKPIKQTEQSNSDQMTFDFDRRFAITDEGGTLRVKVKRPPERIELVVTIDARAS